MDMGPGPNGSAAPPSGSVTTDEVAGLLDWKQQAPLRTSGADQERIYAKRNRDYPDDTDICFERGNQTNVVRLTPADKAKLLEAVGGLVPELSPLLARSDALARQGVPEEHGRGNDNTAKAVTELVLSAHAAGYRLACDDIRATHEDTGFVIDLLNEMREARRKEMGEPQATDAHAAPFGEIEALRTVIALLGGRP